jgi:ubiquinone/menaquinone biosynthesis C-methylase UbiE
MSRHVRLGEFLAGVEGLALIRELFTGTDASAESRIEEIRRIVGDAEAAVFGLGADVPELEVVEGYARWAATYDAPGNPLVCVEQETVWGLLDTTPPGRALDAACGTGRHARRLIERGHEVVGLDASPEMLARARENLPAARFESGDLSDLPFRDAEFDLAVCALALDHVGNLNLAIEELARVVRDGGRVIISDVHPLLKALGGAAYFRDAEGASGVVRGHARSHGDYLNAFAGAGLEVTRCIEPRFGHAEVQMQQPAATFIPTATEAAYLGLHAALIWDLKGSARS